MACSQTLYFLFEVCQTHVINLKPAGDLLAASARGRGWGRKKIDVLYYSFLRSALANFSKNQKEKQNNVCVQARGVTPLEVKATLLKSYRKKPPKNVVYPPFLCLNA